MNAERLAAIKKAQSWWDAEGRTKYTCGYPEKNPAHGSPPRPRRSQTRRRIAEDHRPGFAGSVAGADGWATLMRTSSVDVSGGVALLVTVSVTV